MKKLFLLFLITNMTAATLTGQVMMMFSSDPASGITSPLDIDSLFYWYAADVGVTTNNNKVTQWNDLSGNGHHVTQADTSKAPTYSATGGPNSRPTLTFDGTNDFLASAAHFWGSDDLTVIVVMKFGNATRTTGEQIISRRTATPTYQWNFYGTSATPNKGNFQIFPNGSTTAYCNFETPTGFKHINWKSHVWTSNGAETVTLFSNGSSVSIIDTDVGASDGSIVDDSMPLTLGAGRATSPNEFLQGSISEIIVYSRALTTAERQNLEQNYLCKKYGLACP